MPTVIDVFCGAGGMSHGFAAAGFTVLAGIDLDSVAHETFQRGFPLSRGIQADMRVPSRVLDQLGLEPRTIDCLIGGPPCQGFSRNRSSRSGQGIDPRNTLYETFFVLVEALQPRIVVLENVPDMLSRNHGGYRDAILHHFERLGYHGTIAVLNAADFGVPQSRKRVFFLARWQTRVRCPDPIVRAAPRPSRGGEIARGEGCGVVGPTVWDAISDLVAMGSPDDTTPCSYLTPPHTLYQHDRRGGVHQVWNHVPRIPSERQLLRMQHLRQGQGNEALPPDLQTKSRYGSAYRRMQADALALTITTWMFHPGSGMVTHPFADRVITVREAARLQSFHDSVVFCGSYHDQCRLVGNAVPPLLAKALAEALLRE